MMKGLIVVSCIWLAACTASTGGTGGMGGGPGDDDTMGSGGGGGGGGGGDDDTGGGGGGGPSSDPIIAITGDIDGFCAVATSGARTCWGETMFGSTTTPTRVTTLFDGSPIPEMTEVASGFGHACARVAGDAVECWGGNQDGQVGVAPSASESAVRAGSHTFTAIAAGDSTTCGIDSAGAVRCWGRNLDGELGHATGTGGDLSNCGYSSDEACNAVDSVVPGIQNARGIAVGDHRACAITSDYGVSCWGLDLGHATTPQPITTSGLTPIGGARALVGRGSTFCAVTYSQGVWCWGSGTFGQLATGAYTSWAFTASQFGGLAGADDVAIGDRHVCALVGGEIRCAGSVEDGQLGDGTQQDGSDGCASGCSATPRVVGGGLSHVVQLAASTRSTCALTDAGAVYCWGGNGGAALGHAPASAGDVTVHGYPLSATPVQVQLP